MKKRILSILLAVSMALSLLVIPAGAANSGTTRFSDISDTETAKAVEALRLMGVLDGYGDGTFRPNTKLTRAQFCKMAAYIMNGGDQLGLYRTVTVFPDVKPSYWAASYINLAAKGKNIISGYPDGQFHPDRTVTLGQAVTILLRLLGYQDENIGGVWPDSYVATAATIGLTGGVGTDGTAPLTRAQAARLFLNLLRSDLAEGGSYLSTLGTEMTDVVLVTSSAATANGQSNGLQLNSSTQVYQLASGKTASGTLNGCRGTLVLNKQGKALTFIPDADSDQKVITLLSATNLQITDSTGAKYAVTSKTSAYYNGETTTWGEIYSWLHSGTSMTLYRDAAGAVNYVLVGGGGSVSAAVVIYENGSGVGFDSLTNGAVGYSIYKNGALATLRDLRKYDVATYDPTTNSIRVCDTRVSVYYESCAPNPQTPESIRVLGRDFDVLPTAMSSVSEFQPGQRMTLLLTEGGQVAGAVETGTNAAQTNAVGIVRDGKVQMLCGSAQIEIDPGDVSVTDGQLVRITSASKGAVTLYVLKGGSAGSLNVTAKTLGGRALAENVLIFRDGEAVSIGDLTSADIPSSQIVYARVNWADKIDLIVLQGEKDSDVIFGRVVITYQDGEWVWNDDAGPNASKIENENGYYKSEMPGGSEEWVWNENAGENETKVEGGNGYTIQIRYEAVVYGNGTDNSVGPFKGRHDVQSGDYVMVTLNQKWTNFTSMEKLTALKDVPNSAWTGQTAVTVGGQSYAVPSSVLCYNRQSRDWVTLNEAHAYANTSTLYVYDGTVRIIEVG